MSIWPDNKKFAFTIFDDTDYSTLDNAPSIYSFLRDCGFCTTKSVWPLAPEREPTIGGETCANPAYLSWVRSLIEDGFEIGFHNATSHTSLRERSAAGLERFKEYFGSYPSSMANHADCQENIYFGSYRLNGVNRVIYNLLTCNDRKNFYRGHIESDELFWGDLCKQNIKYVRNFVFQDINTLKQCPFMPYHDECRLYVNYWFASSEGGSVNSFNKTISEADQDRLDSEGGACIMYTHFGAGFYQNGRLNKRFKYLIERLSKKNGWFVPVTTLLDHLKAQNGEHIITKTERTMLELKWLMHKVKIGRT
jgi:hypothetical protein